MARALHIHKLLALCLHGDVNGFMKEIRGVKYFKHDGFLTTARARVLTL